MKKQQLIRKQSKKYYQINFQRELILNKEKEEKKVLEFYYQEEIKIIKKKSGKQEFKNVKRFLTKKVRKTSKQSYFINNRKCKSGNLIFLRENYSQLIREKIKKLENHPRNSNIIE